MGRDNSRPWRTVSTRTSCPWWPLPPLQWPGFTQQVRDSHKKTGGREFPHASRHNVTHTHTPRVELEELNQERGTAGHTHTHTWKYHVTHDWTRLFSHYSPLKVEYESTTKCQSTNIINMWRLSILQLFTLISFCFVFKYQKLICFIWVRHTIWFLLWALHCGRITVILLSLKIIPVHVRCWTSYQQVADPPLCSALWEFVVLINVMQCQGGWELASGFCLRGADSTSLTADVSK